MICKHINSDFDHVDQRKTERKIAFKTTENKRGQFSVGSVKFKARCSGVCTGASVNKGLVGNAETPGKFPAQAVQGTLMRKPAIESKARRMPPGTANRAASYQDVLCSLLVQQCQCLQHQGMPDLKVETFTGDPLRLQFFMTMFETAVEAKTKERLAMLIEFTNGEPKHLIEACLYQ